MPEPKLLDQVRQTARMKHFSLRTERATVEREDVASTAEPAE